MTTTNRKPTQVVALLALLVIVVGIVATVVSPPSIALAGSPGLGWVKADVVGGGCQETPSGTYCSSSVTPGSPTLYEYAPARQGYSQGVGPGRPHGGYSTYELRDYCIYRGVNYGLAAGIWHQGARWTMTFRNGQETWSGPSNRHWAFEHTDACRYDVAPTAIGATATAIQPGPDGTITVPTNPPWTPPTPTLPLDLPQTPVPTDVIPTPEPRCYREPLYGMAARATQNGTTYGYGTAGYYVPDTGAGDPPGTYYMPTGAHTDPPWPDALPAAPISAGSPVVVAFDLTRPFQDIQGPQNPLAPFYQWGGGKVLLKIIDRGTNLSSSADDGYLFLVSSDRFNPTKGSPDEVQNGNPVVRIDRWDMAPGVTALGPQTFSAYNWDAAHWWEQMHSHDPGRGDYAPPSDPGWPSPIPLIGWGRNLIRTPSVIQIQFTPVADHIYDVVAEVEAKYCDWEWGHNYRLMRLANYTNNPTPTPTGVASSIDVGITQMTPRITTPGAEFTYRLILSNARSVTSDSFTVTDYLPSDVTFVGSSPPPSSTSSQTLSWGHGPLPPSSSDQILITVRVKDTAGDTLRNTATVSMVNDADPSNNSTTADTRVVRLPAPAATFRLRIHSDFDPNNGIYTSTSTAVKWPANEVLDFAPQITLSPPAQPPDGLYTVSQRVVAWSFAQMGSTPIGEPNVCKPGTQPSASDLDGADLTGLDGCDYKYIASPTEADMAGMAHAYWWAQSAPTFTRDDVYVQQSPAAPTQLVLEYAVLTVARENGTDLDGDGRTDSVITRSTTTSRGAFQVTLLTPRSGR